MLHPKCALMCAKIMKKYEQQAELARQMEAASKNMRDAYAFLLHANYTNNTEEYARLAAMVLEGTIASIPARARRMSRRAHFPNVVAMYAVARELTKE